MVIIDIFHDLTDFLSSFSEKEIALYFIRTLSIFLVNVAAYSYILVKFFKVLCYSKMTFEWLPMVNPYIWPFSVFHILTGPYFAFWAKILPSIKLDKSSVEISGIIALEVLNSLIYFCVRFTNLLIIVLDELEKNILLK
jgi:hypothetical protein